MRPLNTDREAALACGDKKYTGNPCATCGGTERYTRNHTCVFCHSRQGRERRAANPRQKPEPVVAASLEEARATKARFYYGKPCFRHPTAYRYRINGHCIECKKAMDKGEPLEGHNFPTFEGEPCAEGHTTRYVSTRRCVECHRGQNKEGYGPNEYAIQKRREERAMKARIAAIRAARTERQRACAYGVRV